MEFKMFCSIGGLVNTPAWTKPKLAKLTRCPAWLKLYSFYTHRPTVYFDGWALTEASTGFALAGHHKTRAAAIKAGRAQIIKAGKERWEKAIADAQKKIVEGIA